MDPSFPAARCADGAVEHGFSGSQAWRRSGRCSSPGLLSPDGAVGSGVQSDGPQTGQQVQAAFSLCILRPYVSMRQALRALLHVTDDAAAAVAVAVRGKLQPPAGRSRLPYTSTPPNILPKRRL